MALPLLNIIGKEKTMFKSNIPFLLMGPKLAFGDHDREKKEVARSHFILCYLNNYR